MALRSETQKELIGDLLPLLGCKSPNKKNMHIERKKIQITNEKGMIKKVELIYIYIIYYVVHHGKLIKPRIAAGPRLTNETLFIMGIRKRKLAQCLNLESDPFF